MKPSIKPGERGARIGGLRTELAIAFFIAAAIYDQHGRPCVLTEGLGGKHKRASTHYSGRAIDLRTQSAGIEPDEAEILGSEIRMALGEDFDVVVEGDHIHVEFDPKTPINNFWASD